MFKFPGKFRRKRRTAAWLALGVAPPLLWVGYSALFLNHRRPLRPALDEGGQPRTLDSAVGGRLTYYADDSAVGRPLILIHSVNASASSYEMRPLFLHYRGQRPVYALDLPGFGLSERGDRPYTPQLYAQVIAEFAEMIVGSMQGGADVVALSLGCEFVARAAVSRPELFHSLVLVSPTGFSGKDAKPAPVPARSRPGQTSSQTPGPAPGQAPGQTPGRTKGRTKGLMSRLLSSPMFGQAVYDLLVTRPSLYYFLGRSFEGPVDQGLLEYDYDTTHQPGARYAPLRFIARQLFTPDVQHELYDHLQQPVLVLYDRDGYVDFDGLPAFRQRHPAWITARVYPTRGLPHFDEPSDTMRTIDAFHLQQIPVPAAEAAPHLAQPLEPSALTPKGQIL